MRPEITLIKKSGPNPVMSKRIFLDVQGKVCSDGSQCLVAQGIATRAADETAADLASSNRSSEVWQPRIGRNLTDEDARQIAEKRHWLLRHPRRLD